MKRIIQPLLICLTVFIVVQSPAQEATKILQNARIAYGRGWTKVNYIHSHYFGHTHWLEQSENPNGPFVTDYYDVEEVRSITGDQLYQTTELKLFQNKKPYRYTGIVNDSIGLLKYDTRNLPMGIQNLQQQEQWLLYDPINLLTKAENHAAVFDKTLRLDGVDHYQVSFKIADRQFRLFFNAYTHLLSEAHIDTYLPYEFFFSLWGKFVTRVQYTLYALNPGDILYPMQWDIYRTDQLWKKITINDISFMETVSDTLFTVPDQIAKVPIVSQKVNQTMLKTEQTINVADGIFVVPGNWFTGWVEHEDGILIIEAPINSAYSEQLVTELKKRYPDKKIKVWL